MCDPVSLTLAAATGLSAVSSIAQGNAQKKAADYNASIADENAKAGIARAKDAQVRGTQERDVLRDQGAGTIASMNAAFTANGLDTSFGSPLHALTDATTNLELDLQQSKKNSDSESKDLLTQATSQQHQATLSRMEGRSAQVGGYLNAAGAILGGASNVYKYQATVRNPPSTTARIGNL